MAKIYDEVRATRETVQEATDLYNRGGIQITRYSAGRGKLGVQVSTGLRQYIQLTEPQMKTLAQILPKLQRDLRKDLMKKEDIDEALKGDQHKLDHDKDGDIDGKDFEALRNKKKKKKGKEDTAEMNPKLDNGKDNKAEQKESTMSIRDKLIAVLEGDRAAHYKGATKPQEYKDILGTGPGAKKMIDDHKPPANVDPKLDGNVAAKTTAEAGKKTSQSKKRNNDKDQGDKKIVNPAPGAKTESTDKLAGIKAAYESMYEKKDVEEKLTPQQKVARDAGRGKDKHATDYVKARMKAAAGKKGPNEPTGKDLDRRMHKGEPSADLHYGERGSHDTSARPKDKLATQPDIKKRLKNKKAMGAFQRARQQSQSPSGRNNMGGVGIRY